MSLSGILLLDKPQGPTSHDLVGMTRRALGTRRVGHAGTLDPMATGLMILGVESSTRLLTYLVGLDKEYTATIRLGQATDTDDTEGSVISSADASALEDAGITTAIAGLTGDILQVPSSFSAIKVDGVRSYERARAGEALELVARPVRVSTFEVLASRRDGPLLDLDVRVAVSSGTYVRALARDLGAALGVGGHLTALRRTIVGPFSVADAVPPRSEVADAELASRLLDPADVARRLFPVVELDAPEITALAQGKRIPVPTADAPVVAAIGPDGRLRGLVTVENGIARVLFNFPTAEVLP
ncbi:MAG: tRNA pseudouridine(55) synthase TruB [Pseudolysinimonas sp.]